MSLILLQALMSLASAGSDQPRPDPIDPGTWILGADYPEEALRAGAEGTVIFEVAVDAEGKPGACSVTTSSGHAVLDNSTCSLITQRARFRPALDEEGGPVLSTYSSQVAWKLPDELPRSQIAIIVDFADSSVPHCRAEWQPASDSFDSEQLCALLLSDSRLRDFAQRYRQVAFVTSVYRESETPLPTNPAWGTAVSRVIIELSWARDSSLASCRTLVAEGEVMGKDPCAGMLRGRGELTEEGRANARTMRSEATLFGLPRD